MRVFILPAVALPGLALLSGCLSDSGPPAQPSFYASMAEEGATVDAAADAKAPRAPLSVQAKAVAKAVWDNLPGRFDRLTVIVPSGAYARCTAPCRGMARVSPPPSG